MKVAGASRRNPTALIARSAGNGDYVKLAGLTRTNYDWSRDPLITKREGRQGTKVIGGDRGARRPGTDEQ